MRIKRAILNLAAMVGISALGLLCVAAVVRDALADEAKSTPPAPGAPPKSDPALPPLPKVDRPPAQQPPVGLATDSHLDKTPPRATKGLDLVKAGWAYNCMECHKLFPARWHYGGEDRPFNEHKDIHLEHGNNRFCLNCHHPANRNAFVDYDSSEIAQADVVQLCAKCHGTIYRDWQAGVHGRQNGFWKPDLGDKTKLRCIQCHDPHSPKFKEMKPLPPLRYPARAVNPPAEVASTTAAHH
ncbi:MAG: hypothetical protein IT581_05030 [Verrucomicrobiales bacterium]|nr:hypothetical protein [Verrucomicrobiales bacterium]